MWFRYGKIYLFVGVLFLGMAHLASASDTGDGKIERAVRSLLLRDVATFDTKIEVVSAGAIVRLAGVVSNLSAKDRAVSLVQRVRGVRSVVDDLRIRVPVRPDSEVADDVERVLAAELGENVKNLDVEVSDGVATLKGQVFSGSALRVALQSVRSVAGVRRVTNEVRVEGQQLRSDEELRDAVEARLRWDVWVEGEDLEIVAKGGRVIMTGTVMSPWVRDRVIRLASDVSELDRLDFSKLDIDPQAPGSVLRARPHQLSDTDIARAIGAAFSEDPGLSELRVVPAVSDGNVFLAGRVNTRRQSERAFEIAKDTVGVRQVETSIKIEPQLAPPDFELVASVRIALANDPALEDKGLGVAARDGVVTLAGTVPQATYRVRAARVADRVVGVSRVVNRIQVSGFNQAASDAQLAEEILDALYWNPFVDEDSIETMVSAGVVRLSGKVRSLRASRAAEISAQEAGAVRVENLLTVGF